MMLLCLVAVLVCLTSPPTLARNPRDAAKGCTAPYALPNLPFFVVWNVPSGGCEAHGINLNLTTYRIVTNKNDQFMGENMVIFYGFGDWPQYRGNTPSNGGIPQEGNLSEHFRKAEAVTNQDIPDPNYSGLAVIDFESWRPHLPLNFDSLKIYQTKSVELVKKQHPTWTNTTQIMEEATRQFDIAARCKDLYGEQLRPKAYWGYYGYPRCWGPSTTNECPIPGTWTTNDKYMGWLFSTNTGLFPRIYTNRNTPMHSRYLYVRQTVNETLRVQAKWSGLNTPIMPYTLSQDNGTDFFQKDDLKVAIEEPAAMGASGVVIWGSSSFFHTSDECHKMQNDINKVFGPFVKNLTDFTQACANELCNNHGRCIRKDFEATTQNFLRLYQKEACVRPREEYEDTRDKRRGLFGDRYPRLKKYEYYVCRCLPGWSGEYCNKS
ncbi:hyaluronidase B-like [Haliotis rubra]|uniref:hyaluronidase B-like n=1 Tax=Haliotis rubra TaxID=36100 RepID=UPI001EE5E00D|nr:hyaluronidase B-like [Haliotis rubra]